MNHLHLRATRSDFYRRAALNRPLAVFVATYAALVLLILAVGCLYAYTFSL